MTVSAKMRKEILQEKMRKKAKEAKNYTQALGEQKYAYTKKKWLKFRIKQSSTRGILNFRAKGIEYFGPLTMKWKVPYICPAVVENNM